MNHQFMSPPVAVDAVSLLSVDVKARTRGSTARGAGLDISRQNAALSLCAHRNSSVLLRAFHPSSLHGAFTQKACNIGKDGGVSDGDR